MDRPTRRQAVNPLGDVQQRLAKSTLNLLHDQLEEKGIVSSFSEDGTLRVGAFEFTKLGLVDHGATADDYLRMGAFLGLFRRMLQWFIADWYAGSGTYGQTADQLSALVGIEPGTLYNWASTARAVEISRRRENLSFKHHTEVAAKPAEWQDYWLASAAKFGWSASRLRATMIEYPDGLPDEQLPPPRAADLLPSGRLPIMTKKDRRTVNELIRVAREMSPEDLKKLDSERKRDLLEAVREMKRIASDIEKGLGG